MSIFDRLRPISLAAVGFPTLCVLAVQFLGHGAASVQAYDEPAEFESFFAQVLSFPSDRQASAERTGAASPFYFEPVEAEPDLGPRVIVRDKRQEQAPEQELPGVNVSSILPNPRNPLAVIDGKPRRIGDTLDSGWTVISINASDFTVTLRHSTGKEIREGLKKN